MLIYGNLSCEGPLGNTAGLPDSTFCPGVKAAAVVNKCVWLCSDKRLLFAKMGSLNFARSCRSPDPALDKNVGDHNLKVDVASLEFSKVSFYFSF